MKVEFKFVEAWGKVRLYKEDSNGDVAYWDIDLDRAMKLSNQLRQSILEAKAHFWDVEHGREQANTALHEAGRSESIEGAG